jgi:hypothetical protein
MRIRDAIGISRATQTRLSRAMQVVLVGLLFVGIYDLNPGIVVNCVAGLVVAKLPAVLERDYSLELDAGLTLWITTAAFLHALGTVGLPGMEQSFYRTLPVWDSITHALSASVVAAAGYTTVRALDEHDPGIELPRRVTFVYVITFTMAFGVVWEVLEYAITLATGAVGVDTVLTQYGVEDTLNDLVFNMLGGLLVAAWGHVYLTDLVGDLQARMGSESPDD